jgi:hydroxyacylglutathione hydrolase
VADTGSTFDETRGEMKIAQFRYSADNLAYLLYGDRTALAIDGGAVDAILDFAADRGLALTRVTNTHGHGDHTAGTGDLARKAGAERLDHRRLAEEGELRLDGERIEVIPTPGHTGDSICFYTGSALIAGDTLFNGTVGNPFSGDLDAFYRSIQKLLALPDETIVYAGHDYVKESLAFARYLEPDNFDIDAYWSAYDPDHVHSTLGWEKRINPYLRYNAPAIVDLLRRQGYETETEIDRWRSLMAVE